MAGPFGAQDAGGGSTASPLDGPPPSPTAMGGPNPAAGGFKMGGLGGPAPVPTGQMPPEVLTGITSAAQTMDAQLDAFAQVTPDKATQLSLIKQLLQQYLADLMTSGAGPVSPTAPGPAFPGGGMQAGIAGPGAI